jgi:D-psicose/D-tagatose/L-ribulose 3-epimerase
LREVARYAGSLGVTVGIEPVNRYETYLVNTSEQALTLKRMIDEPNVKVHLDTYHMNIEEKSFYDAVKLAGEDLIHLHLCENMNTWVWRQLAPDGDTLVREGVAFIREMQAKYGL